jgi:hypothetical protein
VVAFFLPGEDIPELPTSSLGRAALEYDLPRVRLNAGAGDGFGGDARQQGDTALPLRSVTDARNLGLRLRRAAVAGHPQKRDDLGLLLPV